MCLQTDIFKKNLILCFSENMYEHADVLEKTQDE